MKYGGGAWPVHYFREGQLGAHQSHNRFQVKVRSNIWPQLHILETKLGMRPEWPDMNMTANWMQGALSWGNNRGESLNSHIHQH